MVHQERTPKKYSGDHIFCRGAANTLNLTLAGLRRSIPAMLGTQSESGLVSEQQAAAQAAEAVVKMQPSESAPSGRKAKCSGSLSFPSSMAKLCALTSLRAWAPPEGIVQQGALWAAQSTPPLRQTRSCCSPGHLPQVATVMLSPSPSSPSQCQRREGESEAKALQRRASTPSCSPSHSLKMIQRRAGSCSRRSLASAPEGQREPPPSLAGAAESAQARLDPTSSDGKRSISGA